VSEDPRPEEARFAGKSVSLDHTAGPLGRRQEARSAPPEEKTAIGLVGAKR